MNFSKKCRGAKVREIRAARRHVGEQARERLVERHLDMRCRRSPWRARLTPHSVVVFGAQVLVLDDVLEEEHHVVGGEGLAVRPFVALAQLEGDRLVVVVPLPGARDVRNDGLEIVGDAHQHGLAPAQDIGGAGGRRARRALDGAAIGAARLVGQHDQRLLRAGARRPAAACRPSRRRRRAGCRCRSG